MFHDPGAVMPFRIISWDSDATWGNTWTGQPRSDVNRLWGTSYAVFI